MTIRTRRVVLLSLLGLSLICVNLYAGAAESYSSDSATSIVFSPLKGTPWVKECVARYPEISWLADDKVRKTGEGQAALHGSYSEQLYGRKYIEFDRTIMTIYCLKLFLDGGDEAYSVLTADQPEDIKLSKESFRTIHLQLHALLTSHWGGMSSLQMAQTMVAALVFGDMGKSQKARDLLGAYGAIASDHDDFYEQAMPLLEKYPELCRDFPSFAALPEAGKRLIIKVANLIHYGHVTHLEGGLEMFTKLKESAILSTDPVAFSFDLAIHICDVAGALGHVNKTSSLVYTEPTHQTMQRVGYTIRVLSDPRKGEIDVYNAYLSYCASSLGLNAKNRSHRILARIGALMRLRTPQEGKIIQVAMIKLIKSDPSMRHRIIAQVDQNNRPYRTPTYIPAVLVNLSNNPRLGMTKEERLAGAITEGLPFIVRVLERYKELLAKREIDPNIPLNLNKIAEAAKGPSSLLDKEFLIDKEGNVHLLI